MDTVQMHCMTGTQGLQRVAQMSTIWDDELAAMSTTCAVEHSNCVADCLPMTS